MLKALIKKQFLEFMSSFTRNRKKGKNAARRISGAGYAVLLLFAFFSLGMLFFMMGASLADPLFALDLEWLYYAMMGLIAVLLGTLGSVFSTYTGLYLAKDNDMLLSMPIPPSRILTVRMISVYLMGLLYESMVMIPALIAGWTVRMPSAGTLVMQILLIPILALVILALTCLLGWLVALLSVRFRSRSYLTVIVTLLFLGGYYYIYFQAQQILSEILTHIGTVEKTFRVWIFPAWQFGLGAAGDVTAFLIFLGIALVLTAITVYIMSASFLRIATTSIDETKKVYKGEAMQVSSMDQALLRREFKSFTTNSSYMLNCALGTLVAPIAAVLLLVKGREVRALLDMLSVSGTFLSAILTAAVFCLVATNDLTAPSISLEGKNLWIVQSLPVPVKNVLRAKQKMHLWLTLPPATLLSGALVIVCRPGIMESLLILLNAAAFTLFFSAFGLALNLKHPRLDWTNINMPIKQSISVMLSLFGGWSVAIAVTVGGYFLRDILPAPVYLGIWLAVLSIGTLLLNHWLNVKGTIIFDTLTK